MLPKLKARQEEILNTMVNTFQEQKDRDRELFLIAREIEMLENPESYEENKTHWEDHEIRF